MNVDASPWYPVAVEARHQGATATVDPDRSLGWIRRALPIVRSHKLVFTSSLVATVAAYNMVSRFLVALNIVH